MHNDFEVAKAILEQEGKLNGVTAGNSMRPLFRNGKDSAIIVPIKRDLRVNDVLLYRKVSTNELILHRVVKLKNGKPVLRGDSTFFNETNIPESDILGVMEGFYRNGKYYNCQKNTKYKIYVFFLHAAYPFRRLLHKAITFVKIIKRKIKRPT